MEIINIMILWLTLGLIVISMSKKINLPKPEPAEKTPNEKQSVSSFFSRFKFGFKLPSFKKEKNTEEGETETEADVNAATPDNQPEQPSQPVPKQGTVFVAELSQTSSGTTVVMQPKETEEDFMDEDDGIPAEAEVEEDVSIKDIVMGNAYEPETENEVMDEVAATEEDWDEEAGEYNTFTQSEEPWYTNEEVVKLTKGEQIHKEEKTFNVEKKKF